MHRVRTSFCYEIVETLEGQVSSISCLQVSLGLLDCRYVDDRYTSVIYNTEAREAESCAVSAMQGHNVMRSSDSRILHLDPLIHDAEVGLNVSYQVE